MNTIEAYKLLKSKDACAAGLREVMRHPNPRQAWRKSQRADHLLWCVNALSQRPTPVFNAVCRYILGHRELTILQKEFVNIVLGWANGEQYPGSVVDKWAEVAHKEGKEIDNLVKFVSLWALQDKIDWRLLRNLPHEEHVNICKVIRGSVHYDKLCSDLLTPVVSG